MGKVDAKKDTKVATKTTDVKVISDAAKSLAENEAKKGKGPVVAAPKVDAEAGIKSAFAKFNAEQRERERLAPMKAYLADLEWQQKRKDIKAAKHAEHVKDQERGAARLAAKLARSETLTVTPSCTV